MLLGSLINHRSVRASIFPFLEVVKIPRHPVEGGMVIFPQTLGSVSDALWIVAAVLSICLNVRLIGRLTAKGVPEPSRSVKVMASSTDASAAPTEGLPRFHGRLSHVVIEVPDEHEDYRSRLRQMFHWWQEHPPCEWSSHPSSWAKPQATLTLLLRTPPSPGQAVYLRSALESLPRPVSACFVATEVRHAALSRRPSDSLPARVAQDRELFLALLANSIQLERPSHVLYLSPECRPLQTDWLNRLDRLTRAPCEPFWMSGSIYRGARSAAGWPQTLASYLHIGRYGALYNLDDGRFLRWYQGHLPAYVATANQTVLPFYEGGRWEMDIAHYIFDLAASFDYKLVNSKFRLHNLFLDYWNTTVDLGAIRRQDPEAVMVLGVFEEEKHKERTVKGK